MTETFDSYNRKTTLYYILLTLSILTILSIVIAKVFDFQVSDKYSLYLITLMVLGLSTIIVNMLLTATGIVKMYNKSGELTISTEAIILDANTIKLTEIKKIIINANDYRGARASDGSGNKIEVYNRSNKAYSCRFVISSGSQRDNLLKILDQWNTSGVSVILNSL